jgi:hypothetical protein
MKNKLIVLTMFLSAGFLMAQLPVGSQRNPVYTDNTGAGNILNTPLSSSNQISIIPAPSAAYHLLRYLDITNSAYSPSFITVTASSVISATNDSNVYKVNGSRGLNLSVTNVGIGMTNVEVFSEGLLTNKFTIP